MLYLAPFIAPGLLQIDAQSLKLIRNLGPFLPATASILGVKGSGQTLYLGGHIQTRLSEFGASSFYAVLNLKSLALNVLSSAPTRVPRGQFTNVDSIVVTGTRVFFGGEVVIVRVSPTFDETSVGSILVAFNPSTAKQQDLTGLSPRATSIQDMVRAGATVALITLDFSIGIGLSIGGLFVLSARSNTFVNETAFTGTSLAVAYEETSESGGLVFLGGSDTDTGASEFASIPVADLLH